MTFLARPILVAITFTTLFLEIPKSFTLGAFLLLSTFSLVETTPTASFLTNVSTRHPLQTANMRPEVEQELAHTLLVELLAYQFASPVRWIETQDVFLAEKTAERIVEIGPADTLGVMAKRTLASKYEAYDAAKSVQRQILCYNKDAKEIYYDVDPIEEEPEPTPEASPSGGAAPAAAAAAPVAAAPAASAGPAAQVPDAPVQALEIVRALIAQKLKKPYLEVPLSKAIKDLVGGEYTFHLRPTDQSMMDIFY